MLSNNVVLKVVWMDLAMPTGGASSRTPAQASALKCKAATHSRREGSLTDMAQGTSHEHNLVSRLSAVGERMKQSSKSKR